MPNQAAPAPFLDIRSYAGEAPEAPQGSAEAPPTPVSPFLSSYELEEGGGLIDPVAEDHLAFLNELYDEEFDEALFELAGEASAHYENWVAHEASGFQSAGFEAEQTLEQFLEPLAAETEAMLDALGKQLGERDPAGIPESEIETRVDGYQSRANLSPTFEYFFKKLKGMAKKVAGKAVNLAKKGAQFAGRFALGPLLNQLKALVRPLLRNVLRSAIGRLPSSIQPLARQLANRFNLLKEIEEKEGAAEQIGELASNISEVQNAFNMQVADLLFANGEVEQEAEVARVVTESKSPAHDALAELDLAREEFIRRIGKDEDPTPHVERFIPAILPVLKTGISLIGRKRVVDHLAQLVGALIQKLVGPQHTPTLSRALVDVGLTLLHLETSAEDEAHAANAAVAATVEETVRRVAALPDYILDSQEALFDGFALEAFEQAAAANLPPILSEETYRKRPELREAKALRGAWVMMPLRGARKRYKKFSRPIRVEITPQKAISIETFGGVPLAEFLEEQLGVSPGETVEAEMQLYESIPGGSLAHLAHLEQESAGPGGPEFHPLTPEVSGTLLGEPGLGREVEPEFLASPHKTRVGQRFYHLKIPGRRPLMASGPDGRVRRRQSSRVGLLLDFPANQARIDIYLSEICAQRLAAKLRQQTPLGLLMPHLRRMLDRGLRAALIGGYGRLKIVHEAVTPDQWLGALRRLPAQAQQVLFSRLHEWTVKGVAGHLKTQTQQFITAASSPADGVTLTVSIGNPPGFAQLRQVLRGQPGVLGSLNMSNGSPNLGLRITPGYAHG